MKANDSYTTSLLRVQCVKSRPQRRPLTSKNKTFYVAAYSICKRKGLILTLNIWVKRKKLCLAQKLRQILYSQITPRCLAKQNKNNNNYNEYTRSYKEYKISEHSNKGQVIIFDGRGPLISELLI